MCIRVYDELIKHEVSPNTDQPPVAQTSHPLQGVRRSTDGAHYTQQHRHIFQHGHERGVKDTEQRRGGETETDEGSL